MCKSKKKPQKHLDQWEIFGNTHDAIIDEEALVFGMLPAHLLYDMMTERLCKNPTTG